MALTQITTSGIANNAVTTAQLAPGAAGGPKITQIQITNSSGTVLDDTAISLSGGYIKITGTGFAAGAQVIVNNTPASATTFTSDTVLNAQIGAESAGTYVVYVVNTDGGVAIAVNGLTYSSEPIWVTGSTLPTQQSNVAISVQLNATGATTYALASGSTLPAGLSLSSGGLLSGTISIETETTYSFIIDAIDNELQDSPRTFSLTVSVIVADPYFYLTTLLLPGNGANNATNNTFVDSSTNNFTVTRVGNTTQGNFSPFSQTGWSNLFDGNGDYLTAPCPSMSGTWTIELWWYPTVGTLQQTLVSFNSGGGGGINIWMNGSNQQLVVDNGIVESGLFGGGTFTINAWNHVAIVRNGSTTTGYINGAVVGSNTFIPEAVNTISIGRLNGGSLYYVNGYISNLRVVIGTEVYTSNFTPPAEPLTAIANTSLLTCQSNRFIDNSTNNFTITRNGDVSIQSFSPFNPTTAYSSAVVGGSGYFDGSGDYLTLSSNAAFDFGTGDFTVEAWVYFNGLPSSSTAAYITDFRNGNAGNFAFGIYNPSGTVVMYGFGNSGSFAVNGSTALVTGTWYHMAWVRSGSTFTMYLNGITNGTGNTSYSQAATSFTIGARYTQVTEFVNGYIQDLRIVKGTAVYTANFTPPTAPLTAIANTSLLLNFTNGTISDATSKNVVETVGDAKISTAVSKFGGSSMYFDGSGDRLIVPSSPNFDFTGDFTIEMWINFANVTSTWEAIISRAYALTGGWRLYKSDGNNQLVWYSNVTPVVLTTGSPLANNTWSHIAVVRNNGTVTIYIDGVNRGSAANTTSYTPGNYALEIGEGVVSSSYPFEGYIQDLRITKGYARYTTTFTPPTAAFPIQ